MLPKKKTIRDSPGDPVVKTCCFQCNTAGFVPGEGTKIPHTMRCCQENVKKEENDDQFIRRERFYGECSRSFYVGDDVEVSDIDAEFKNGILKVRIPKKESQEQIEESKQIEIK